MRKEGRALAAISDRIENGAIIEQKNWSFIRELNSWSRDRLNKTALIAGDRENTYRQMFREWDRYAAVFSSLGITEKTHSRVLLKPLSSVETFFAYYALNMTGTSVSMVHKEDTNNFDHFRKQVRLFVKVLMVFTSDPQNQNTQRAYFCTILLYSVIMVALIWINIWEKRKKTYETG